MHDSLNYGFFFYYHFVVEWLGFILAYTVWSVEISVIQSLVQKQKTVALPEWSFDVSRRLPQAVGSAEVYDFFSRTLFFIFAAFPLQSAAAYRHPYRSQW